MSTDLEEIIQKVNGPHESSVFWNEITKNLEMYLMIGDLDLYLVNNIQPAVFTWAQDADQNKKQLQILEKESFFYKIGRAHV